MRSRAMPSTTSSTVAICTPRSSTAWGQGVESPLAVGAYRHARRAEESLAQMHPDVDRILAEHYHGEAFVTGALARLALDDGLLEWTNAAHPAPLLLRSQRVVKELSCAPSLPLGLGGECREVAKEALEPGDCLCASTLDNRELPNAELRTRCRSFGLSASTMPSTVMSNSRSGKIVATSA